MIFFILAYEHSFRPALLLCICGRRIPRIATIWLCIPMARTSPACHQSRYASFLFFATLFIWCDQPVHAAPTKTGFLVIAPDRGALGNQDIQAVFEEFMAEYAPASLVFVGRDYKGIGSEYSDYMSRALAELRQAGALNLVAIPFFLSGADPILQKVKTSLPAYGQAGQISWAQPMSESYLIGQVVVDRAMELSREPDHEQVMIVGFGATDAANEQAMHADLKKLSDYVARYRHFQELRTLVYYDQASPLAEARNASADAIVTQMAAKKGHTLAIFATLGPKFDHMMALTSSLTHKFQDMDVTFARDELVPHPNVLRWLKKTANAYLPATAEEIGVVIMPHGANQVWNDAVERMVAPLKTAHQIEMAFGMGDPAVIQNAVERLESRNIRRIVFVRLYALARHLKDRTDYVLGLADAPPSSGHGGHDGRRVAPPQVRSAALFASFGGYEESPDVTRILHERIMEISREPAQETVILIAHGEKTDEGNAAWLSVVDRHIERLKQDPHCAQLKALHAATVREDWPEKRDKAVAEIRTMIQNASGNGRALVIANRLYGSGPYRKLFDGLEYTMSEKGLAHPVLTQWLEKGIAETASILAQPLADAARGARQNQETSE